VVYFSMAGDLGYLLFVKFAGDDSSVEKRMTPYRHSIAGRCSVLECASDEQSLVRIWQAGIGNDLRMAPADWSLIGVLLG
jgi:hypothetical protein